MEWEISFGVADVKATVIGCYVSKRGSRSSIVSLPPRQTRSLVMLPMY